MDRLLVIAVLRQALDLGALGFIPKSGQRDVMAYWNPEADPARTCFPAGQGVGGFREIKPAGDVLREIVAQAEAIVGRPPFANGR